MTEQLTHMEWIDRQVIGKDPDAGKIKGRRSGQQRMRWLDGITHSMDMSLSKFGRQERTGKPAAILQSIGCKELDTTKQATKQQQQQQQDRQFHRRKVD